MLTRFFYVVYYLSVIVSTSFAQKESNASNVSILSSLTIIGQETANQRPVNTYETPIANLDFDPRVDMQSRNMAEAQGDLSIRGGTFENTGVQVGTATLLDPQTGHYTTEIPIAPEMLGEPKILTGTENALRGFNSSVGTVSYSWSEIKRGGSLTIGGGDHDLNFERIHQASTGTYGESKDFTWGAEIESSRSESDGTIPFGDHAFDRTSARIQFLGPDSQTDIFAGYQHKLFGLYGMYTGDLYTAFNPYESENIKTSLFILNHDRKYGEGSSFEITAYHRENSDHYLFNRFSPNQNFVHDSMVSSVGVSGLHTFDERVALNYGIQITSDEIESSSLENGTFTNRNYYKVSLLPEYRLLIDAKESLTFKGGISWDDTSRDKSTMSTIAEISWIRDGLDGNSERTYISYAEAVQFPGYGAIGGSENSGLFRSNHNLNHESSRNLEFGYQMERITWSMSVALFYRWDDDLVDWAYVGTGARSAQNVDIETSGLECIASRQWNRVQAIASYAYLNKDEDYGNLLIDGSFYALNYPNHRATLGLIWLPHDSFEIRIDNEWRDQRENPLRKGPKSALYSHFAASYYPAQMNELEIFAAYEKPWDENFQDIPGTPGRGDQFSLGFTYSW
jgi:vitamin B12 transporter